MFTADAPQAYAYNLLRATKSGGHADNVLGEEEESRLRRRFSEDFE